MPNSPTHSSQPSAPLGTTMNDDQPSQKRKREDTDDSHDRPDGWHPRYGKDQGPEVTLESDDGCLFKVRQSLLTAHSTLFAKWMREMKADWILHLHTDQKVVALLLDLMATPHEITTMADLDDLTVVMTDHAAKSFKVEGLYPTIDKRMEILLSTRPFEMLKIASDHDLPDLARRAIKHMTPSAIYEYCGSTQKREEYLEGLKPDWQLRFYRTLLRGTTKSCRKLESEIRSIVKLDPEVFLSTTEVDGRVNGQATTSEPIGTANGEDEVRVTRAATI